MSISFRKLTIDTVRYSDIPRVVDYLLQYYFTDEPLSKCTRLTESTEAVDFLRKFCTDALRQNISVMARTDDGNIAAVACNMILTKGQKFDFGTHPEIRKISDFVTKMVDECAIHEKYPGVEDYMYLAFMSVHKDFRKQGLAKRLIDLTRELAVKLGLKVMRMDCCSLYTAKAAQRLRWTCLKEIAYEEYRINGKQVFHPEEPHTIFGLYAMKTEQSGFLRSSM